MKIDRITDLEKQYALESLAGQFETHNNYRFVTRLEKTFAEKIGTKHAIGFVNGTATLHTALEAAGVSVGDEVIVPPLTMSSTCFAVLMANAIPVFADIEEDTFLISAKEIENKITDKTKAVIVVSLFGLMPDMDSIMDVAKRHGLVVIEDDAQCFMGSYKGRMAGTIGDMASFSFQASKHLTSGEGGMVTTNNDEYGLNLRRFSGLGYGSITTKKARITKDDIQDPSYERHFSLGWNYRMSDVVGAVALAQTERMEELCNCRMQAGRILEDAVTGCDWLIPQRTPNECVNAYWTTAIRIDNPSVDWYTFRRKFMEFGGDGIYAAWKLNYLEPVFRNKNFMGREVFFDGYEYKEGLCPIAEKIQPQLLQFKTNYWDTDEAVQQADILRKTIKYFNS